MGKVIMNKRLILLFLLFLAILTCSTKPEKPIPEKQLEGWAGNPDNPNEKPFDYFYMHTVGKTSPRAIEKKNGDMIKEHCTLRAIGSVKGDLIGKMINDSGPWGSASGQLYNLFPSNDLLTLDNSIDAEFQVQGKVNPFNTQNLVAITSKNELGIGYLLWRDYSGKIDKVKGKHCKPLYLDNPEAPGSEWKECECIVYIYIKGGREAIRARAEELDRE